MYNYTLSWSSNSPFFRIIESFETVLVALALPQDNVTSINTTVTVLDLIREDTAVTIEIVSG